MDNLEQKLSNLPKYRLRFKADLKIKFILYKMTIQKKIASFSDTFSFHKFVAHRAWLVGLLVISMVSSVSFYAYGSEQITLGNTLYPIKKTVETAKNILTASNVDKVSNFNELSSRRLEEALVISNKEIKSNQKPEKIEQEKIENNVHIVETINRAIENFDESVKKVEKIDNEDDKKNTVTKLKEKNDKNLRVLEEIEKNVNIVENEQVAEKINEAKEKIKKYNHDSEENDKKDREDKEDKRSEDNNKERKNQENRENREDGER